MHKLGKLSNHTFASLHIRNFRLYFIGQAISSTGNWMQIIALGLLILQLTGSGTMLGFILGLQFLPTLFFGPVAGVIVDRYSKRKILYFTQSASGILALSIALILYLGLIKIWMIYIFAVLHGSLIAIDNPTRNAFITQLVGKDFIKNAIALNLSQINLARIIGPALGGILIAAVGTAACFLYNGISFIAVLIVLSLINEKAITISHSTSGIKGQLHEGFSYIRSIPILKNTLLMVAIIGTFTFEFAVTIPLFAKYTFNEPTTGYASLMSAMGLGAIVGGLFSANAHTTDFKKLIISSFIFGLSVFILAIMPTLPLAIASMILVGFCSVTFMSSANTILQTQSIPEMRGRVMSLWTVAFLGSTPIGGLLAGLVGEHAGPRWGIALGGFAALCAAGIGMGMAYRKPRSANSIEPITLSRLTFNQANTTNNPINK